jgi:hypothetical protein
VINIEEKNTGPESVEKMNVTRSLLVDVKSKQLQWYRQSKGWRGDCQKGYWNGDRQGEGNEADRNLPGGGIRGMMAEKNFCPTQPAVRRPSSLGRLIHSRP